VTLQYFPRTEGARFIVSRLAPLDPDLHLNLLLPNDRHLAGYHARRGVTAPVPFRQRWLVADLANIIFAATISAFAIIALVIEARHGGAAVVKPIQARR
jgi:hypothetical protein